MNYRFNKTSSNFRNSSSKDRGRNSRRRYQDNGNSKVENYGESVNSKNRKNRSYADRNSSINSKDSFPSRRTSSKGRERINSTNRGSNYSSLQGDSQKPNFSTRARATKPNARFQENNFNSTQVKNSNYGSNSGEMETTSNQPGNDQSDLLWGRHATQAAFETGRPIHRIWCTGELRSSPRFFQFLRDAKSSGVLVEEVSWARLAQITSGAVHQGIALQTAASETVDLKKLIEACSALKDSALLLALDGLTDPHNLGAIIRSAEALGAHGLVLPQRRSAGLTGSVAKVAAGALEHLPVARVVNLNRSLVQLKDCGYSIIGLAEEGETTLQEAALTGPLVVVIGSENKGLSVLTRKHCDQLVRIPLRGVTTSLNASIATSVVLYEIARNSWMKGISGQSASPKLQRIKFASEEIPEN